VATHFGRGMNAPERSPPARTSLEVTEKAANPDGQQGTAFGLGKAGTRPDVIVTPATGQFIDQREIDAVGATS
jgi:hypothetical protein